jgi:putative DNA primase/helicase
MMEVNNKNANNYLEEVKMNYIQEVIQQSGFSEIEDFPLDSKIHTFPKGSKKNSIWVIGFSNDDGSIVVKYGSYKTGEEGIWSSTGDRKILTNEELTKLRAETEKKKKTAEREKNKRYSNARKLWQPIFDDSMNTGDHPYLKRKGIDQLFTSRLSKNGELLIPVYNSRLKFAGVQIITELEKKFAPGTEMSGSFSHIGTLRSASRVIVAEGFATAASIRMAVPEKDVAILITFNANNLKPAIDTLRDKINKNCEIVVAADDDIYTTINGKLSNVGKLKAAHAIEGEDKATFIIPVFDKKLRDDQLALGEKLTDFNDLHISHGLDEVSRQFRDIVVSNRPAKTKVSNKISELEIALNIVSEDYVSQGDDLFFWTGTHWKFVDSDSRQMREIYRNIDFQLGDKVSHSKSFSVFKLFLRHSNSPPVDLWRHRPNIINFNNFCLKVVGHELQKFEHNREDYCTYCLDLEFDDNSNKVNQKLIDFLSTAFGDDDDAVDKIHAVQELFGACLLPRYPRIYLLHGVPAAGKSTIIKILEGLLGHENISRVSPSAMGGFRLNEMVNKLANVVHDIDTQKKLNDEIMKMVEDGGVISVDRKFQKPIIAKTPMLHIYACNALPPIGDGESRAYDRRVSIIDFLHSYAPHLQGQTDKLNPLDVEILSDLQGVINFALEGLSRLIKNKGFYTVPESSKTHTEQWQDESDIFTEFLREESIITRIKVCDEEGYRITKGELRKAWTEWQKNYHKETKMISKNRLYNKLRDMGFNEVMINGTRYFKGISRYTLSDEKREFNEKRERPML